MKFRFAIVPVLVVSSILCTSYNFVTSTPAVVKLIDPNFECFIFELDTNRLLVAQCNEDESITSFQVLNVLSKSDNPIQVKFESRILKEFMENYIHILGSEGHSVSFGTFSLIDDHSRMDANHSPVSISYPIGNCIYLMCRSNNGKNSDSLFLTRIKILIGGGGLDYNYEYVDTFMYNLYLDSFENQNKDIMITSPLLVDLDPYQNIHKVFGNAREYMWCLDGDRVFIFTDYDMDDHAKYYHHGVIYNFDFYYERYSRDVLINHSINKGFLRSLNALGVYYSFIGSSVMVLKREGSSYWVESLE